MARITPQLVTPLLAYLAAAQRDGVIVAGIPPETLVGVIRTAGLAGAAAPAGGLITLEIWPTLHGTTLVVLGRLWRIDRLGLLHDQATAEG